MPIDLYPNIAKVKRSGVYQNLPGFVQASGDADIKAMIANSESSTTAQYAHSEGSYFILNDILYKATIDIAVNDIISVGTNCEVAILCNDVSKMENDVDDLKSASEEQSEKIIDIEELNVSYFSGWEQGNAYRNTSGSITKVSAQTRCRLLSTSINSKVKRIVAKKGYKFNWNLCTLSGTTYTVVEWSPSWTTSVDLSNFTANYYLVIVVAKTNDTSEISTTEASNNVFYTTALADCFVPDEGMYIVGSNLMRQYIRSKYVGRLTQGQAFCKYNDKYYSIGANAISVQDSDFTAISTTEIGIAHPNTMQLGENGKAYVSGWDNNKLYVVDLETLTIDSEIALPVTGYTSCAVDENNGLLYIFQRSSNPVTTARNNFVVYDYINEETKLTKETKVISPVQGCAFVNDKIIVLCGGGTASLPNQCMVYSPLGDILAEYYMSSLNNVEPEGVFVDSTTGELFVNTMVSTIYCLYKIEEL